MFRRVAWHVQELSPHVLHVNGQVLVCARAYATYELGAMCNSWRARIPGRRSAGRLHQEFLKNTARKEGGARNISLPPHQLGRFIRHPTGGQRASQ